MRGKWTSKTTQPNLRDQLGAAQVRGIELAASLHIGHRQHNLRARRLTEKPQLLPSLPLFLSLSLSLSISLYLRDAFEVVLGHATHSHTVGLNKVFERQIIDSLERTNTSTTFPLLFLAFAFVENSTFAPVARISLIFSETKSLSRSRIASN
jgi:hypothetical protein